MDTNQLQNKLFQFEALPPEGAWDKIVDGLESAETFAERLFQYEETPLLRNWERIEKTLEEASQPAKVIPFGTRFKKPIRYIAAASIIGLVLIISTLFLKRTEAGAIQTGSNTTVPTQPAPIIKKDEPVVVATPQNVTKNFINQSTTSLHTFADAIENKIEVLRRKPVPVIATNNPISTVASTVNFIPAHAMMKPVSDFSLVDNYMICCDEEGHAMKVPKKLFSLVQCKDGDGTCRERIRQLQQKLSSPTIATDFSGVLEMLQQLQ